MTIAHKNLTGTDLHEVKGASTATAGQVPISDGAGGAPFGKLDHNSLQTTGNPFGAQFLHANETQASNVQTTTSGATGSWLTTVLNTTPTNEISGASLASNILILPAGTYYIRVSIPWLVSTTQSILILSSRLQNTTAGTTVLWGRSIKSGITGSVGPAISVTADATIEGRFTLAATSNLVVQHYKTGGQIGVVSGGTATDEIYTQVSIWKVA